MAELLIIAVIILMMGLLGRMAGGWLGDTLPKKVHKADTFVIGILACYLFYGSQLTWWTLPFFLIFAAVGGWLGEKPGVGHCKGFIERGEEGGFTDLESWESEFLRHRPYTALALRGCIWGGLIALCCDIFTPWFGLMVPAYGIAMPAGMKLGTMMPFGWKDFAESGWDWSEIYQQLIAGTILALVASIPLTLVIP